MQADLEGITQAAHEERRQVDGLRERVAQDRLAIDALLAGPARGIEFVAVAWADYEHARAETLAYQLEHKSHPARSAAEQVRLKGKELARARRDLKRMEWALRLYELHVPWLSDLRDLDGEIAYVSHDGARDARDAGEPQDPAREWLSAQEYQALSESERNQRALDRYLRASKSPWQIGRDYARYIGYHREMDGAQVRYQGIFAGLEDLGRDLVCEHPDGSIEVVQCKAVVPAEDNPRKAHLPALGTVVAARIDFPGQPVRGTFTTTTSLSERAQQFASHLGITVEQNRPLEDYPRIKCNIARSSGARIYHLLFDQQYDTTVIEPERGERWVSTVAEAEALGFRRAWRWHGRDGPAIGLLTRSKPLRRRSSPYGSSRWRNNRRKRASS